MRSMKYMYLLIYLSIYPEYFWTLSYIFNIHIEPELNIHICIKESTVETSRLYTDYS